MEMQDRSAAEKAYERERKLNKFKKEDDQMFTFKMN